MGLSNAAGFKFMVGSPFQFVSLTPKSQPWRLPASPARFFKAAIFRMQPAQIPGQQVRKMRFRRAHVPCRVKFHGEMFVEKSFRRLDDGEDCGLECGGKFFPSGDYL